MKYVLHNKELINGKAQRQLFLEAIEKNLTFFKELKSDTKVQDSIVIYLSESDKPKYTKVSVYLNINDNQLYADGEGEHLSELVNDLLSRLKSRYLKHSFAARKRKRLAAAKIHVDKLQGLRHAGDRSQFDFLMKRLTPSIKGFVINYIAHKDKKLDPAITIDDFLDEVYLALFEKFEERLEDDQEFSAWSFKIAREKVDKMINENMDDEGSVRLNKLAQTELDDLEEKFTIDAEGELIMYEELDDISYSKTTNMDTSISGRSLLNDLQERPEMNEILRSTLENTSTEKRTVFQLYWYHEMTEKEIANAMELPLKTVHHIIDAITEEIIDNHKT